jgi:hypothetical protein
MFLQPPCSEFRALRQSQGCNGAPPWKNIMAGFATIEFGTQKLIPSGISHEKWNIA